MSEPAKRQSQRMKLCRRRHRRRRAGRHVAGPGAGGGTAARAAARQPPACGLGPRPARAGAGARQPPVARTPRRLERGKRGHVDRKHPRFAARRLRSHADRRQRVRHRRARLRDALPRSRRHPRRAHRRDAALARLHGARHHADNEAAEITLAARRSGEPRRAARRIRARLVVHAEGTPASDPACASTTTGSTPWSPKFAPSRVTSSAPGNVSRPMVRWPCCRWRRTTRWCLPCHRKRPPTCSPSTRLTSSPPLRAQFGSRLDFVASGPRASFPLALRVREQLARPRQVWIGNAAQSLHPVSGQGFNLGLRDAWELAAALLANASGDAGDAATLAAYARARRLDRRAASLSPTASCASSARPGAATDGSRPRTAGTRRLAAAAPLRRQANDLGRPRLA
jgi:hypothetical protein